MKRLAPLAGAALLAAGLIGFTGIGASAAPQAAQPTPSQTCVLIIICFPAPASSSPGSSAKPSLPLPTPSLPLPTPSLPAPSLPTPSLPLPSVSVPNPSALASAAKSAVSGLSSGGRPSPSPTTPKNATAPPGLVVSNATWTMTVSSATLTGFTYKGNVNLPLAGGGTVKMMEFTVESMTMTHAVTQITEDGQTGTETDASFSASGVTMYATRLSGSILGVPVTFTPSTTSAVLLRVANLATGVVPITMTGVTADQAVILAGQAQKTVVGVAG
jgi:hypothetical protein